MPTRLVLVLLMAMHGVFFMTDFPIGTPAGSGNRGSGDLAGAAHVGFFFTATVDGFVTRAEWNCQSGNIGGWTPEVYAVSGGNPSGPPLATGTPFTMPVGTVVADYPTPAAIVSGQRYCVTLSGGPGSSANLSVVANDPAFGSDRATSITGLDETAGIGFNEDWSVTVIQSSDGTPPDPDPDPPPPPPPPGSGPVYLVMVDGQSNAANFFNDAQGQLLAELTARNPKVNWRVIGSAHPGTPMSTLLPGTAFYNDTIAAINAQADAAGFVYFWFQGEADSSLADDAIIYGEQMVTLFDGIASDTNIPLLGVAVAKLHANAESSRPYWRFIQDTQELITMNGWRYGQANTFLVDLSDLQPQADPVHLSPAQNQNDVAPRLAAEITGHVR